MGTLITLWHGAHDIRCNGSQLVFIEFKSGPSHVKHIISIPKLKYMSFKMIELLGGGGGGGEERIFSPHVRFIEKTVCGIKLTVLAMFQKCCGSVQKGIKLQKSYSAVFC